MYIIDFVPTLIQMDQIHSLSYPLILCFRLYLLLRNDIFPLGFEQLLCAENITHFQDMFTKTLRVSNVKIFIENHFIIQLKQTT